MKKIIKGVLFLYFLFGFSGCGNGSSNSENEDLDKKYIPLTQCSDLENMEGYTILKSNDEIISDEENSSIVRYYNEKGVKRVCVMRGDAHVERVLE